MLFICKNVNFICMLAQIFRIFSNIMYIERSCKHIEDCLGKTLPFLPFFSLPTIYFWIYFSVKYIVGTEQLILSVWTYIPAGDNTFQQFSARFYFVVFKKVIEWTESSWILQPSTHPSSLSKCKRFKNVRTSIRHLKRVYHLFPTQLRILIYLETIYWTTTFDKHWTRVTVLTGNIQLYTQSISFNVHLKTLQHHFMFIHPR